MKKPVVLVFLSLALALSACGGGGGGDDSSLDVLFFAGNDGAGGASFAGNMELWSFDGASPSKVAEIYPGTAPSYPQYLTELGDLVVFKARDDLHGSELFATDGLDAWLVRDIVPGDQGSHPADLKAFGDRVFMILNGGGANELWSTDGTEAGTQVVAGSGQGILEVTGFAPGSDGNLYFTGTSSGGTGLFYVDSDSAEIHTVCGDFIDTGWPNGPGDIAALGTDIFFPADDGVRGMELWMYSVPGIGCTIVADLEPGDGGSGPGELTAVGVTVAFSAERSDVGRELWSTTGAAGSTTLVADIFSGADGSWPWSFFVHGGLLYFTARDGISGWEPYVTDLLSPPAMLADINSGASGSMAWHYQEYDGKVYFYAVDEEYDCELWVTDGTGPGTEMVFDLNPDGNGAWPD